MHRAILATDHSGLYSSTGLSAKEVMSIADQGNIDYDSNEQRSLSMDVDVHTTDSGTWQEKVFKIVRQAPQWTIRFKRYYTFYTDTAKEEEGATEDLVHALAAVVAIGVASFLSVCVDQGIDTEVDHALLNKDNCCFRLNGLQHDKRIGLLERLETLLVDSSVDQATWTDRVTELMNDNFFLHQASADAGSNEREVQKRATIASWAIPYRGKLHEELWNHISRLYNAGETRKDQYANMCAIIQSSGTGKSRMVDQLGTEHFVIPICLRDPGTTGFPPPDDQVRKYLLNSMELDIAKQRQFNESYAIERIDAFFSALFKIAETKLEEIINDICSNKPNTPDMYSEVSAKFRRFMTEGQSYQDPNEYRQRFYRAVVDRANELLKSADSPTTGSAKRGRLDAGKSGDALADKLKSLNPSSGLVFVVAFDESAMLTRGRNDDRIPPILTTLCKQLNLTKTVPFFSLFLSTTGQIAPFLSPFGLPDGSTRILEGRLKLNPAFTGCTFDAFDAERVAFGEGRMSVQQAASEWTMMHLGRPLWATRVNKWRSEAETPGSDISTASTSGSQSSRVGDHDAKAKFLVRRDAMRFAVIKLLNWTAIDDNWQINDDQMIACLCHRLPVEFQSTSPFQYRFVENHMRICVRLDPEDQTMVSMSSSEPVLSEASFVVMKNRVEKILPAMKTILGGFSVNKGDRGELVALLILLLARDEAVSKGNSEDMWKSPRLRDVAYPPSESPRGPLHPVEPDLIEWNRVFTVPDFLRALFGEIEEIQENIDSIFEDTRMHFNHFIKCFQQSVLQRQYLAGLLMRGAALLCANCQEAVDAVTPFSFEDKIERFLTGAILYQIKNGAKFTHVPIWELFDAMEQCRLGIVDKATRCLPSVVRVVFALAASQPSVSGRVTEVKLEGGKSYLAVDIWCAGISIGTLPCIQGTWMPSSPHATWNSLLASSQGWKAPYIPPGEDDVKDFLRCMTPCLGEDPPFWKFCPELTADREEPRLERLGGVVKGMSQLNVQRHAKRKTDTDPATVSNQATTSKRGKAPRRQSARRKKNT